jgi:hypothetical protein
MRNSVPIVALGGLLAIGLAACREDSARKAQVKMRADVRGQIARPTQRVQAGGGPAAGRARNDSGPAFARVAGYVVRGSDESSFRACGSTQTHYLRPLGEAAIHVTQRYRFRASMPLAPVYFVFNARVLEDTVNVGDFTYTSVIEVRRVMPEQTGEQPDCPAPMRGSMIARQ